MPEANLRLSGAKSSAIGVPIDWGIRQLYSSRIEGS